MIALVFLLAESAWCADAPPASPPQAAPSKEMREKMASMHDQMAACLRTDKSLAECRKEMMKACKGAGRPACPMMDMGGGTGMDHEHNTQPGTAK